MGSRCTPMRGVPRRSMQANAQEENFISPCISLEENGLVAGQRKEEALEVSNWRHGREMAFSSRIHFGFSLFGTKV